MCVVDLYVTDVLSVLGRVFKDYLSDLVHDKEVAFRITLKTAIPETPIERVMTTYQHGLERAFEDLEIRVLTPAFYSRLVHYTDLSEAVDRECIFTDEKNRTLWICRPQLLPSLLPRRSSFKTDDQRLPVIYRSYLDELRWRILRKLRCPPADPVYSMTPTSSSFHIDDIRARPYSELDNFVRKSKDCLYAGEYRRAATKLFLAQRYCFGFSDAISLVDLGFRALLCYIGAVQLSLWSRSIGDSQLLDCFQKFMAHNRAACFGAIIQVLWFWLSLFKGAGLIFACHAYGLLKGYN